MAKSCNVVLLLFAINLSSTCVMGQSTVVDDNNVDLDIAIGLSSLAKNLQIHSDASVAFRQRIQTEFENLVAKISRLEDRVERQETCMNNSINKIIAEIRMESMEMKSEMQQANSNTTAQISQLQESNYRQLQMGNIEIQAQIARLENRVYAFVNISLQEYKREILSVNTNTTSQISRLDKCIERHDVNMNNSLQGITRQMQLENTEMKNEIKGLNQKLSSRHCPSGFNYGVAGLSKCYAVLTDRLDWNTAQERCRQLHNKAQLALIINSLETQIATEILRDNDCRTMDGDSEFSWVNEFWIGARRSNISNCDSSFEWASHSGPTFPIQYSNWAPGEPNCGRQSEACVSIFKHNAMKWNDLTCSWRICSLCEVTIRN